MGLGASNGGIKSEESPGVGYMLSLETICHKTIVKYKDCLGELCHIVCDGKLQ